ncbi:MAG: TolC family outer membrane protein, partial [Steroidobacteraceae bacterium]
KASSRLVTAVALTLLTAQVPAANLVEVYQRALQNDPIIREADANRLAVRQAKPLAWSALLPLIDGAAAIGKQDSDGSRTFVAGSTADLGVASRSIKTDADVTQWSLRLQQPVFHWESWVALKRADAQVAQAEVDFKAAEQDLVLRTAQRYFDVLAAKDTVDAAQAAVESFARQLEQADKRFEVGLIAVTDVQEARAAHDSAVANLIAARRSLTTAQELLRELTGESFEQLSAPVADMPLNRPEPQNPDEWVRGALEQNLRLTSTRLATEIAKQDVRTARAGHLPSLDIVAERNGNDFDATQTLNGVKDPNDSDITENSIFLQLTVPIYSGGETSALVKQNVYLHRAARETERSTRDAYLGVISEISRVQALRQAVQSSRTALEATEAGFEVGTRTTVDVLDARRRLFEAQTNYARSRYDYILNLIQLKVAAGTLARTDLDAINAWLGETASLQDTSRAPEVAPTTSPPPAMGPAPESSPATSTPPPKS